MSKATIDPAILAEIDALSDRGMKGRVIRFSEEQDALLVHLMESKVHTEVYRWWRKKFGWGSRDSLTKRYKELNDGS